MRTAPTISDLWKRFEDDALSQKKSSTQAEYRSQWVNVIEPKFGRTKVQDLSRGEVDIFHKSLHETPYRANRILALLSHLMNMAEMWEWRVPGSNPCKHISRFQEEHRTRYLSMDEIGRLGAALKKLTRNGDLSETGADAIRLLLFTGARLNEVLTAKWAWVDKHRRVLNLPDSKTGAKSVYLSEAAWAVLLKRSKVLTKNPFIFPSADGTKHLVNLQKMWLRVCKQAKIDGVRLHDLRHTAASIAAGQGASLPMIGRLLGHTQAQTTQRYAHLDSEPALRAANSIGEAVSAALEKPARKAKAKPTKAAKPTTSKDGVRRPRKPRFIEIV